MRFSFPPTLLLSLLLLLPSSISLFDSSSLLLTELNTFAQIQEALNSPSLVSMFFYSSYDCPKCAQAEPHIFKFAEEMNGLVKVNHLDCDKLWDEGDLKEKFPICNPKNVKNLPQLVFYAPPLPSSSNPQEFVYIGEVSAKAISKFAGERMPAYRELIESEHRLKEILALPGNKVVLFTDRVDTPTLYRGISSHFLGKMHFLEIRQKSSELLEYFGVKRFPTLIILTPNDTSSHPDLHSRLQYRGQIKYEKILTFLQPFQSSENLNPKAQPVSQTQEVSIEVKEVTGGNYDNAVLGRDIPVLVQFSKENEHEAWRDVMNHFENLIEYHSFSLNSESNSQFATPLLSSPAPLLKFYPPHSKKRNSKLEFPSSSSSSSPSSSSFAEIISDIGEFLTDKSLTLTLEASRTWIEEELARGRVPVVFMEGEKEEEINLWKAATNVEGWKDKISFGRFKKPTKLIMQAYNVNKLPALFAVMGKGQVEHQVAHFTFNYTGSSIRQFLAEVRGRVQKRREETGVKRVKEIANQDDFEKVCGETSKFCFVAFVNLNKENAKDKRATHQIEMLEKAVGKSSYRDEFAMGYINGPCYPDLMTKVRLNKDSLPTLIAYQPSTAQYAPFLDFLKEDKLLKFIEGVFSKRVGFTSPKEELDIDERDCKEHIRKLKEEEKRKREEKKKREEEERRRREEEERKKKEEEDRKRKQEEEEEKKNVKIGRKKKEKKVKKEDL